MDKQKFFATVQKIHSKLEPIVNFDDGEDYVANQTYNKVVVNGVRKPENMGEKVALILEKYGEIGKVYKDQCWLPGRTSWGLLRVPTRCRAVGCLSGSSVNSERKVERPFFL